MKRRSIISIILVIASNIAHSDDNEYDICFIKGFFAGEGDKFMKALTTQIAEEKGLINDPECISAHKSAFTFGVQFSITGKYNTEQEHTMLQYASAFRKRVNTAVIKLIE